MQISNRFRTLNADDVYASVGISITCAHTASYAVKVTRCRCGVSIILKLKLNALLAENNTH